MKGRVSLIRRDFSSRLVAITFDVERDWYQGRYCEPPVFDLVTEALERVLDLADSNDLKYTLFVTAETLDGCRDLLKEAIRSGHEIATHTHPRFHRDIFKGSNINDRSEDNLAEYQQRDQETMIRRDTESIRSFLGSPPISFRAGRLSANCYTLRILASLGYKVDSSFSLRDLKANTDMPAFLNFCQRIKIIEIPVLAWIRYPYHSGIIGKLRTLRTLFLDRFHDPHSVPLLLFGAHLWEFGGSNARSRGCLRHFSWLVKMIQKDPIGKATTLSEFSLSKPPI